MPDTISIYDAEIRRPATVVVDTNAPFVPHFLEQAVGASSTRKEVGSRVQGRHLLLQNQSRARAKTREKKNERKKGIKAPRLRPESWRLPDNETKFEAYVPLHRLWLGYISELLGLGPQPTGIVTEQNAVMPNVAAMHAKLVKADFHGSIMTGELRQSTNPCLVGLSGLVIYESENGFRVITRGNKLKMLPKQKSVFGFCVPLYSTAGEGGMVSDGPHAELELYGDQIRFRASERASRKFKHKESIVL